jgi:hypothetical protein
VFQDQRERDYLVFTGLTITFLKQFGFGLRLTLPLLLKKLSSGNNFAQTNCGKEGGMDTSTVFVGHSSPQPQLGMVIFGQSIEDQGCLQY